MKSKMNFRKRTCSILTAGFLISALFIPAAVFADEVTWPADIRELTDADYSGKTVILHSNDVHGAINGYASIAWLREEFERNGAEVIMADAGDFSQGDPNVGLSEGEDAIVMMNEAGYDVSTIGNHEFDYSTEKLDENLNKAEFNVICANVVKDEETYLEPSWIKETANGTKIGFLGLNTPETQTKVSPRLTAGVTFLSGKDMYACAQEQVDSLKEQGADMVIALTNLGVNEDSRENGIRSLDLYDNTTGIDFIIDGHSHTVMTSGQNGEPIQSTGTRFEYIGIVVLNEKGEAEDHYLISTENMNKKEEVQQKAQEIIDKTDEELNIVFAESELEFDGRKETNRTKETNNGNLITDALMWFVSENPGCVNEDADHVIALMNGGGIRDGIPEGEVTKKDINKIYPFMNTVATLHISGKQLLEVLEASTYCTPDEIGGFPQTEGIRYTIDTTMPYDAGDQYPGSTYYRPASINRVSIESINGKPFSEDDTIAVVTSNFLAGGGDTCYAFSTVDSYDTGYTLDNLLIDYITKAMDGVLTREKYGKIRGEQTIITDKKSTAAGESGENDNNGDAYRVESGDFLWKIAEKVYGDGTRWTEIYECNKGFIADPNVVYAGQELILPAA